MHHLDDININFRDDLDSEAFVARQQSFRDDISAPHMAFLGLGAMG